MPWKLETCCNIFALEIPTCCNWGSRPTLQALGLLVKARHSPLRVFSSPRQVFSAYVSTFFWGQLPPFHFVWSQVWHWVCGSSKKPNPWLRKLLSSEKKISEMPSCFLGYSHCRLIKLTSPSCKMTSLKHVDVRKAEWFSLSVKHGHSLQGLRGQQLRADLCSILVWQGERERSHQDINGLHTITSLIYHVLAVKEVAEAHQAFTPLRDHRCVGVAILPMSCPNMTSERIEMHKPWIKNQIVDGPSHVEIEIAKAPEGTDELWSSCFTTLFFHSENSVFLTIDVFEKTWRFWNFDCSDTWFSKADTLILTTFPSVNSVILIFCHHCLKLSDSDIHPRAIHVFLCWFSWAANPEKERKPVDVCRLTPNPQKPEAVGRGCGKWAVQYPPHNCSNQSSKQIISNKK